jgi:hypothetical protein
MVEKMLSQVGLTTIGLVLAIGLGFCVVRLTVWIIHSSQRRNYLPVGILAAALVALVFHSIRARHRHPVR